MSNLIKDSVCIQTCIVSELDMQSMFNLYYYFPESSPFARHTAAIWISTDSVRQTAVNLLRKQTEVYVCNVFM